MYTTIIDTCDLAAYRSWTDRRVTPAYMRGMPTWVWKSALCQRQHRRHGATVTGRLHSSRPFAVTYNHMVVDLAGRRVRTGSSTRSPTPPGGTSSRWCWAASTRSRRSPAATR